MICYEYTYQRTDYKRRPTCGGMDSEPDGTEIGLHVYRVIVPDDGFEPVALHAVRYYSGNSRDEAFKIIEVKSYHINQIIDSRTR